MRALIITALSCLCAAPAFAQDPARAKAAEWATKNYKPKQSTDAFTKSTTTVIELPADKRGLVQCTGQRDVTIVQLGLAQDERPGAAPSHMLFANYVGSRWLFIRPDQGALQFLFGDSVVALTPMAAPSREAGSSVVESAVFLVDTAFIRQFADAPSVRARLAGSEGSCDWNVKREAQETARIFAERQMGAPRVTKDAP